VKTRRKYRQSRNEVKEVSKGLVEERKGVTKERKEGSGGRDTVATFF
jgi:hypothetical protein